MNFSVMYMCIYVFVCVWDGGVFVWCKFIIEGKKMSRGGLEGVTWVKGCGEVGKLSTFTLGGG